MTIDHLRQLHGARPFAPMTLHLTDGRSYKVNHPEMLWIPPQASRIVHLEVAPDVTDYIDVLLITSVEVGNGSRRSKRNS